MHRVVADFLLAGRYRLEQRVAAGGMGEVWVARDQVLDRKVAVKVLHPHAIEDVVFLERFREEARNAAQLAHPNVVAVHDFGEHDRLPFLVMEYVDGRTIAQLVREEGPQSPETVRSILAQSAAALSNAHQAGIVHRDVKPANIMIDRRGRVKLTDFGIARAVSGSTITKPGEVLGTPQYLSPEQAMGNQATPASDLYALGVVGHELLTGVRPFEADTPVATALAHLRQPPPPLPKTVPAPLVEAIMSCLEKDQSRRPESAEQLAESLAALSPPLTPITPMPGYSGLAVHAEPAPTAPIQPPLPISRALATVLAVSVVALAFVAIIV